MDAIDMELVEGLDGRNCETAKVDATGAGASSAVPARTSLPELIYPGGGQRAIDTADRLGEIMSLRKSESWVVYGGNVSEMNDGKLTMRETEEMVTVIESMADVRQLKMNKKKDAIEKATAHLTVSETKTVLASHALKAHLPTIKAFAPAPLLVEVDGKLETVRKGFHAASGIYVTGGDVVDVPLEDARALLLGLWSRYQFNSKGDLARAIAATVTPAMIQAGFFSRQAPMAVFLGDLSHSGKGAAVQAIGNIYDTVAQAVSQREGRGVGSMMEDLDSGLLDGKAWFSLDNIRGVISIPKFESLLTEASYVARAPFRPSGSIDPTRIVMFATGNEMEMSKDLQNRSYTINFRLPKDATGYRRWLGERYHDTKKRQALYLGAVHSVVRAWAEAGKPEEVVPHPNVGWAAKLAWIANNIFGLNLLDGYDDMEMVGKDKSLLRQICLLMAREHSKERMRAVQIAEMAIAAGIIEPKRDFDWETAYDTEKGAYAKQVARLFKPLGLGSKRIFGVDIETIEEKDEDWKVKRLYMVSDPLLQEPLKDVPDFATASTTASTTPAEFHCAGGNKPIENEELAKGPSSTSSRTAKSTYESSPSLDCDNNIYKLSKVLEVLGGPVKRKLDSAENKQVAKPPAQLGSAGGDAEVVLAGPASLSGSGVLDKAKPFYWRKEYDELGKKLEDARRNGIPLKTREADCYVNPYAKRKEEMLANLESLLNWKP